MEHTDSHQPAKFTPLAGGWKNEDQARVYAQRMDHLRPRLAGEQALAEFLPPTATSVLDLGCGDGRLIDLVLTSRTTTKQAVGVDNSAAMLTLAQERFRNDDRVTVLDWDLQDGITALGTFVIIVSGFAIHHLEHSRKRSLFAEINNGLNPDGVFLNLGVVQSPSRALHTQFLEAIGRTADDPEDRLATVDDQLRWMREAPLADVDCHWKWRGFALLGGKSAAG